MPWFVIDDSAHTHPKIVAASNAALGLWMRCGSYVAQHLTDGIVPGAVARMYGSKTQIAKLVAAGLWHERGHDCPHERCAQPAPGDYAVHDYLEYNPTRAQVQGRKEREAEKKRRQRAGGAGGDGGPGGGPRQPRLDEAPAGNGGGSHNPPPRPIPADWQPSETDVRAAQLARADAGREQLTGQQLAAVTRKFVQRQLDDRTCAVAWGGRWQQWAENERTDPPPGAGGVVVPFGAVQQTKGQQQRAGLARLFEQQTGEV
ncbi:conserved hypothetical protein [Streptomyces sp. SPB78]|uniref:Uncharacterized protein n=1 Tax=Streptomyces phage SF3 TaxID=1690818 RepID=A0A0M4R9L6_9CAUD|nr:hypothetical protein [Streptomyces sp. SPB78]YP_009213183.1 hypothetical protein AVV12_gp56 [Streptomyces phage SF3]ALF00187.1 hypothetical protein SF3_560 [Streptomyces phage SF3]EFL00610.1 conserved hypothetical protein [Streptomyces sp. SPB78]